MSIGVEFRFLARIVTCMIIGINCRKDCVALVLASETDGKFKVMDSQVLEHQGSSPEGLRHFRDCVAPVLGQQKASGVVKIAVLKSSGGARGSSVEAIKSEAIIEVAAVDQGLQVVQVTPQSLKKALGCGANEKWQARSKTLFNPEGAIKYWAKGFDGAAAAAFKVSAE